MLILVVTLYSNSTPNLCRTLGIGDMAKTQTHKSDTFHFLIKSTNSIYKSGVVRYKALS